MSFITLNITCSEEKRELLIAELSLFPFDAFEETETGLLVSCEEADWEEEPVFAVLARYEVECRVERVEKVNWNEEWKKIMIPSSLKISASFAPHFMSHDRTFHMR